MSGLVMATTLTATGASLETGDEPNSLGAALKDAAGPCITVLTKLVTVVAIVNVARSNWAFFVMIMIAVALVGITFLASLLRINLRDRKHLRLLHQMSVWQGDAKYLPTTASGTQCT